MDHSDHRRRMGLILGLVLGGGYSLSANLVNRIILPYIPLYSPPPGRFGMVLITVLMFGLLGLIAAWGDEPLPSILASGLAGSLFSWIGSWINDHSNTIGMIALLIVVFAPLLFLFLPYGALVRWLINRLNPPIPTLVGPARKLRLVFSGFIVFFFLGAFEILPKETRISLVRMQELLETGMQVKSTSYRDLPKPLQAVEGFIPKATGEYSFIVGSNPDVLPVQRPVVNYGESEPLIIIQFENGFLFGCVFSPPYIDPACIDI